ncbi:hypothetical protein D3C84_824620 [compost metagenome]
MRHVLAQPDPGIKALCGDVDEAVVATDFHRDVRIPGEKVFEHGPNDLVQHMVHCVDTDIACGGVAQITQVSQLQFDFLEVGPHPAHQALAGLGGRNAAGGARQQTQSKACFQATNRMAQR